LAAETPYWSLPWGAYDVYPEPLIGTWRGRCREKTEREGKRENSRHGHGLGLSMGWVGSETFAYEMGWVGLGLVAIN